jgi:hypothetical protein
MVQTKRLSGDSAEGLSTKARSQSTLPQGQGQKRWPCQGKEREREREPLSVGCLVVGERHQTSDRVRSASSVRERQFAVERIIIRSFCYEKGFVLFIACKAPLTLIEDELERFTEYPTGFTWIFMVARYNQRPRVKQPAYHKHMRLFLYLIIRMRSTNFVTSTLTIKVNGMGGGLQSGLSKCLPIRQLYVSRIEGIGSRQCCLTCSCN